MDEVAFKFAEATWGSILGPGIFLIGIPSMQGWIATMRYGVTKKKEAQKD